MKKFLATAFVVAAFVTITLSDYEVRIVKAEAQACNNPDCN